MKINILVRAMNNSNNTPFVGEQLYAINRRYLEALHNYYMVMGSHETQVSKLILFMII